MLPNKDAVQHCFCTFVFARDACCCFFFIPPTLKKLEGHIASGLSVCVCVCVYVRMCIYYTFL